MDATNISINQSRGVSINIEALQAIKQHFNVDTLVSKFKGLRVLRLAKRQSRASGFKIYRKELRLVRTLSRAVDGKAGNLWIGGWVAACVYLIFIYA